ncbi:hypothetical protein GCM10009775_13670 [Microbacterium aoyamense]|uniref:Uncharacterized protein n=2 Tax=Microbacterium aoyamense TaxID=344166 RepID=A0ABP5AYZ8_9MICO
MFRAWLLRALAIGILPLLSISIGVLSVLAFSQNLGDVSGWLLAGLVAVGIAGIVAMLDARTRVAGIFAVLTTILVNPLTATLLLLLLDLA